MNDEQINEVMRLVRDAVVTNSLFATEQIADMSIVGEAKCALVSYLRTIGQPENTFPINPNGSSKWAHLQKHDGAEAIGVVFRTGSGSVGSLVDGRVVWADWLAHPTGSKPESVNAELLDAAKSVLSNLEKLHSHPADKDGFRGWENGFGESAGDVLQDSIDALKLVVSESAIETPAKVSPCAGHAVQQEAELRQIVGIKEAIAGIHEFFDSECHSGITGIVDTSKVCGDRVEDECRPTFDHCYVNQGGGGITGYDFHGTVYFHIGNGEYATVDY